MNNKTRSHSKEEGSEKFKLVSNAYTYRYFFERLKVLYLNQFKDLIGIKRSSKRILSLACSDSVSYYHFQIPLIVSNPPLHSAFISH